jgi:hypothetical protein
MLDPITARAEMNRRNEFVVGGAQAAGLLGQAIAEGVGLYRDRLLRAVSETLVALGTRVQQWSRLHSASS